MFQSDHEYESAAEEDEEEVEGVVESEDDGSEGGEERLFPETDEPENKKVGENGTAETETEERGAGDGQVSISFKPFSFLGHWYSAKIS